MTFSIAGRCPKTGQLGVAISSSSIAVGARCPWLQAGVGAISSQNITLPRLGADILHHLAQGFTSAKALLTALDQDPFSTYRQVIVINHKGETALFSGEHSLGITRAIQGRESVAAGNLLADQSVISAMVEAFQADSGPLAWRLLHALQAAITQGGEAGPVHSAALKVVAEHVWPIVDLRVDWAEQDPIGQLTALWQAYEPQMQAYITRAIDPREAPRYGVPGDE
ncbi:MAG: DUF1028 domain-containing protein [Enterobacteriaceae bacterium]